MHTFTDNAGRVWTVTINVTAIKRVRALLGRDLLGLVDEKFDELSKLMADPCALCDVLYVLCKDEADKIGVTDEDFGRALASDALEHAGEAFMEELTGFFPNPRVRETLRNVMSAIDRARTTIINQADKKIRSIDPEAEALAYCAKYGISPESSESTQDLTHTANSP